MSFCPSPALRQSRGDGQGDMIALLMVFKVCLTIQYPIIGIMI